LHGSRPPIFHGTFKTAISLESGRDDGHPAPLNSYSNVGRAEMEPAGVLVAALLFSLLVFLVYVWSFISGPENGADKKVLYT
jgi:hypothetical protein